MDNIFIERLWRSIKYEEVHLNAYADGCEARSGISSWMNLQFSVTQAMNNQMPMAVWRAGMDKIEAAEGCGYVASLGQRKRVAHIPTAEAAGSGLILEGQRQARLHLKFNDLWSHEWGPVQTPPPVIKRETPFSVVPNLPRQFYMGLRFSSLGRGSSFDLFQLIDQAQTERAKRTEQINITTT